MRDAGRWRSPWRSSFPDWRPAKSRGVTNRSSRSAKADIEGPLYTVIAYFLPAGAHCVETLAAATATEAAVRLRKKLGCERGDLEIVAVIWGRAQFEPVDAGQVALAPYCAPKE